MTSLIWSPMVWTGLNDDIGSWKMSAISAPRIARISSPSGVSFARSTTRSASARPGTARRRNWISPSTIRPGRSTIPRIDRAVTLLPQPLSPTMPSVPPGCRSKVTPSTALTVPSSWGKYVFRPRTERSAWPPLAPIGIGRVAQSIAQEVESHDDDDHGHGGKHQPGGDRHRLDILGLLQQDSPADRGRPQAQTEEAEGGLADDHRGQRQRGHRDDMAHERWHHVHEDGPHLGTPDQPGGDHEVLFAHGQETPPHDSRQIRPR